MNARAEALWLLWHWCCSTAEEAMGRGGGGRKCSSSRCQRKWLAITLCVRVANWLQVPFGRATKSALRQAHPHPPPSPTCAVKCTNAFNIMKFICSSSVPASCLPLCLCVTVSVSVQGLSGSKLQLHREWETATATATGHGSVWGAWQHQQQQLHQQTCPTKSSVPRRLTLNFFHLSAASQVETRIVALCLKNTL